MKTRHIKLYEDFISEGLLSDKAIDSKPGRYTQTEDPLVAKKQTRRVRADELKKEKEWDEFYEEYGFALDLIHGDFNKFNEPGNLASYGEILAKKLVDELGSIKNEVFVEKFHQNLNEDFDALRAGFLFNSGGRLIEEFDENGNISLWCNTVESEEYESDIITIFEFNTLDDDGYPICTVSVEHNGDIPNYTAKNYIPRVYGEERFHLKEIDDLLRHTYNSAKIIVSQLKK